MKILSRIFAVMLMVAAVPLVQAAAEPTAFELIKEGNRYVGEQSKDKVFRIRSEKSVGGLEPTIWYVTFYDPTTTFKAVEVKFGAGKMLDVGRPLRLFSKFKGRPKPFDLEKLKIDSDDAIEIARKQPLLDKIELTAVEAKLERGDEEEPVWIIELWASKLRKPSEEVGIGEIILSAEDGKVIETDLHINRVD